jgi:3-polyprenyl-4-hydroxybenzoate decarboxylase
MFDMGEEPMTEHVILPGSGSRSAVLTLRDWLDRLAATDRLTVMRPGIGLVHELAAIAKRLDGTSASFFPHPGGHEGSVVSGLVSSRAWMAEALGVPLSALVAHFQKAAVNPVPWREVSEAPAQAVVHRDNIDLLKLLPIPTHNEYDSAAEVEWAIATRFQADRDTVIVPNSQGSKLDPSTKDGVGAKMGLDATIPLDAPEMKYKRIRVPGEENVDLTKVVAHGSDWRTAIG